MIQEAVAISFRSFLAGAFCVLSIYHFLVFLGRNNDRSNLAYSLYSFFLSATIYVNRIYPHLVITYNENVLQLIYVGCIHCVTGSLVYFILIMLDVKKGRMKKLVLFYYSFLTALLLAVIVITLSTGSTAIINLYFIFLAIYGILFFTLVYCYFFIQKKYNNVEQAIVIGGFSLVMLMFIINTLVLILGKMMSFDIFYSIVVINAAVFAYALVRNFNGEHKALVALKNNLKKKVRQKARQIKRMASHKETFFIHYTHETKTPLTLINTYLEEHIKKHGTTDELAMVKRNVKKLLHEATDFLDLEKLRRHINMYNHNQFTPFSKVLKKKLDIFSMAFSQKHLDVSTEIEPNLAIRIDPAALDRILNNLFDNAIKYSPKWGKISVSLYKENGLVIITINNMGKPIPTRYLKHIFKPYFQPNINTPLPGSGIGLSIVKQIVTETEGTISVESRKKEGTTFSIAFKVAEVQREDFESSDLILTEPDQYDYIYDVQLEPEDYDTNKKTLLVVEDNVELIASLQMLLGETYNFYYAFHGEAALEKLGLIPKPDLIVSDIMMNVMDGLTFFRHIKQNSRLKHIPFIFLTARSDDEHKITSLQSGVIDYITKPFSIVELEAKIAAIINHAEGIKDDAKNRLLQVVTNELSDDKPVLTDTAIKKKPIKKTLTQVATEYALSERHKEVISCLHLGIKNNQAIADNIGVTPQTVKNYFTQLYKILPVNSKSALIKWVSRTIQ